jgi:hypothetical protein
MGDRSLIVMRDNSSDLEIVMYGHWSGDDNLTAVRNILSKTSRVGDCYLVAEVFHEFSVVLGGYSGLDFGSFGIFAAQKGFDEGWIDAPTIYVNVDTGEYEYEGEITTLEALKAEIDPNSSKTGKIAENVVY